MANKLEPINFDPVETYQGIVEALKTLPGVQYDPEERGSFGSKALKINGKIFAMLDSKQRFVVKLPRQQVQVLILTHIGEPFTAGQGRVMKEWLVVTSTDRGEWLTLARDAYHFVITNTK